MHTYKPAPNVHSPLPQAAEEQQGELGEAEEYTAELQMKLAESERAAKDLKLQVTTAEGCMRRGGYSVEDHVMMLQGGHP